MQIEMEDLTEPGDSPGDSAAMDSGIDSAAQSVTHTLTPRATTGSTTGGNSIECNSGMVDFTVLYSKRTYLLRHSGILHIVHLQKSSSSKIHRKASGNSDRESQTNRSNDLSSGQNQSSIEQESSSEEISKLTKLKDKEKTREIDNSKKAKEYRIVPFSLLLVSSFSVSSSIDSPTVTLR